MSIFAEENIRINAVYPGLISTPMSSHEGTEVEPARREMEKRPMERFGKPGEIADAMVFFAGSETSSFVCGAALVVDGCVEFPINIKTIPSLAEITHFSAKKSWQFNPREGSYALIGIL